MADIRTITILPTQTVPTVQSNAGAGTQGSAGLAGLASGTILNGFIINRDAAGNPILRTDTGGDVTFSSNFFLNIGSIVAIRVENTAAGTLAHILTVNGQPPEIATAQSAFAHEPDVIVSQNLSAPADQPQAATTTAAAAAPAEPVSSAPALTVSGTLIAQAPPSPGNAVPALPTGTQLTLKVTGLTSAPATIPEDILNSSPPQATPANLQPANQASYTTYSRAAGTPVPASPASSVPVAAVASALATAVSNVSQEEAPALPQAPVSTPNLSPVTPQPSSQGMTATVVSNDSSRETNLQTPFGIVRLQTGTVLPPGSTVTFEIKDSTLPAQAAANETVSSTPAPLTELAQQWTSLQQIVSLLSGRVNAPSAFNFIQDTMPWVMPPPAATAQITVPQNIPAGLMLFMAALRGGNFGNWLGQDNVKWLQDQGHGMLVAKSDNEFAMMARQFTESQPAHWQPLFFPIAVGSEVHQARMFVKRDRKQGGSNPQEKKNDDTRFVVEVDLTQLGEMQMDGFVRKRDKDVQFDLIIRSLLPLSKDIQNDILQIYNSTGELAGYKGSLAFQTVKDFPVNPMEEIVGRSGTVVA